MGGGDARLSIEIRGVSMAMISLARGHEGLSGAVQRDCWHKKDYGGIISLLRRLGDRCAARDSREGILFRRRDECCYVFISIRRLFDQSFRCYSQTGGPSYTTAVQEDPFGAIVFRKSLYAKTRFPIFITYATTSP